MSFSNFFKFDRFIMPAGITMVFWLGLMVILIQWLTPVLRAVSVLLNGNFQGLVGILVTLLLFVISCVLWRIICEAVLALFEIRDRLASLDSKTRQS